MYAIRRKRKFLDRLTKPPEYLAEFLFREGMDYRTNPCGYFARHLEFPKITDRVRELASIWDGEIVRVREGKLLNNKTYEI